MNEQDEQIAVLQKRLDRLEGTSIELNTTQVQRVDELSESATTAEVRTAVRQLIAALRTLGLGA